MVDSEGVASAGCLTGVGRIVLLFDGFDELSMRVTVGRAADHLRWWKAHTDRVHAVDVHPDGVRFATAGWDGTAAVWSTDQMEPVHRLTAHDGRLWTAVFQPTGGGLLATGDDDTVVRLWDPLAGTPF